MENVGCSEDAHLSIGINLDGSIDILRESDRAIKELVVMVVTNGEGCFETMVIVVEGCGQQVVVQYLYVKSLSGASVLLCMELNIRDKKYMLPHGCL